MFSVGFSVMLATLAVADQPAVVDSGIQQVVATEVPQGARVMVTVEDPPPAPAEARTIQATPAAAVLASQAAEQQPVP
jgi:hypothetical protein